MWAAYEGLEPGKNASPGDLKVNGTYVAAPFDNLLHQTAFSAGSQIPVYVANGIPQRLQSIQSHASKLSMEAGFGASSQLPVSIANSIPSNLHPTLSHALKLPSCHRIGLSKQEIQRIPPENCIIL
ncbi:unnamed protein product [Prunus armeniaca]